MSDLISRKWLMECVNEGWIKFDTEKDKNTYVHLVRDIAPSAQPETTRILAAALNGSPLLYPCDKLWSREGWCKDHCKKGQTEPDTECWLKYAETIAAERC